MTTAKASPMEEILKGLRTVADNQERLLKRVGRMESELGMKTDEDEDTENMPDKNEDEDEDTEKMGVSNPERSVSTRGQMRQAARDKDRTARSGNYGSHNINPNPGPSRNKHGDSGMTVGNMVRSAITGGSFKPGHRELEVLEERDIPFGREGLTIPWDFLATHGERASAVDKRMEKEGGIYVPKRIQSPYIEQRYDAFDSQGHVRTITSGATSGGGMVGIDLDVARSQFWLHEVSPVLGRMNPTFGVASEYQVWYGNVAPTGGEVAESGKHTENSPTLTRLRRSPVAFHWPWSISGNLEAMDSVGIGALTENAINSLILENFTKAVLSGPNTSADFAVNANSFTGLMGSGSTLTAFGADADSAITSFARSTVMAAESAMRTANAMGEGLFWVLGTPMVNFAVNTRTGGTDSPVYLAQRSMDSFREGLIGGSQINMGTPYVESNLLGRTHATPYKRTAVGALGFGSQMVPLLFGQGIEFRYLRHPQETDINLALILYGNFALVNPSNAQLIGQAVS